MQSGDSHLAPSTPHCLVHRAFHFFSNLPHLHQVYVQGPLLMRHPTSWASKRAMRRHLPPGVWIPSSLTQGHRHLGLLMVPPRVPDTPPLSLCPLCRLCSHNLSWGCFCCCFTFGWKPTTPGIKAFLVQSTVFSQHLEWPLALTWGPLSRLMLQRRWFIYVFLSESTILG